MSEVSRVVHFKGLDKTKEEQKSLVGPQQRKARQVRTGRKHRMNHHARTLSSFRYLTFLIYLFFAQLARRMARNAERERARLERRLQEEELKLFRSFLWRMGGADRLRLLNDVPAAFGQCNFIFGFEDRVNLSNALSEFVQSRGPITTFPPYPAGAGAGPSSEQRLAQFSLLKTTLETTNVRAFKYTDLDRFLQYLFDRPEEMKRYMMDPTSPEGINPVFLQAILGGGDDYVEQFFEQCGGLRSGIPPPDDRMLAGLRDLMQAFEAVEAYTRPETPAQASRQSAELATSG